jgi:hypothetical protein
LTVAARFDKLPPRLGASDFNQFWESTMNRFTSFAFVSALPLLGLTYLIGCGKAPSNDAATTTPAAGAASPSTEAVTRAASDFLDAVLKGDTQRASARLTPQAMQRIIASGKQFSPPGLETATFRIGEVRTPSTDKAFVHCILTDSATTGAAHSEEMCCLMRLVDNDWRVSGIAYWAGPNQGGTMSDFETGQSTPIPRNPTTPSTAGPAGPAPMHNIQTLPPRMAEQQSETGPRY